MKKETPEQKIENMSVKDFVVMHDNVLIKPLVVGKDKSGIVKPMQYEDKKEWGIVIAIGDGKMLDNGTVIPIKLKVGDVVAFQRYLDTALKIGGENYVLLHYEDIHGVLKN